MPELPDITIYIEALATRVVGSTLRRIRLRSPFLLRSVDPPIEAAESRVVLGVERLGKRIVLKLDGDYALVLHLMIAGRLLWKEPGAAARGKIDLAGFDFDAGTLILTEAGTTHRASLHVVHGEAQLRSLDAGGADIFAIDETAFAAILRRENHTLKRSLTDPRLLSGIGNAYSDEILHAARLSPFVLTRSLTDEACVDLLRAARHTLTAWTDALREEFKGRFPGQGEITAFRPGFAAHGRYRKPCPRCTTPIQRIVYAENETNYCPTCQTGGRILADRSLSRLLRDDWPKTVDELETS